MADDQTLKYTFDADASKFVSEAAKAEKAAKAVGNASGGSGSSRSGSGSGSGASDSANSRRATDSINSQTKAWDQHAKKVSDVASKYRDLEQAKSKFAGNPQAIGEINKQQVALLKTMERSAQNEQEYGKFLQARLNLQKQMGTGAYSNHSNRQFGQLQGLGLMAAGMAVNGLGNVGRQFYQNGISSYTDLNNQYRFDPALIQSQNNLSNAQFRLGQQIAPYQQFKNNALASVYNSPVGAPLAIGGDLLGMLAGPVGGALNLAAAYKLFKGGSGAATGAAGAAKVAAGVTKSADVINASTGAVEATTVARTGAAGAGAAEAGVAGAAGLGALGTGAVLVGSALAGGFVGMNAGNFLGHAVYGQGYKDQGLGDIKDTIVKGFAIVAGGAAGGLVDSNKGSRITRGVASILGGTTNSGDDIGSLWADLWGDKSGADKIRQGNLKKDQQKQTADDQSKLDAVKDTPAFQRQFAAIQNQVDDHYQDLNRQVFQTQRDFSRQQQDIARSTSRENEDYGIQQQKFGIQQGRTQFDYNRTTSRAQFDYNRAASRNDEDYTKNTARTLDDYSRSVERTEIGIYRTRRNYAIQAERLQEDYVRQAGRAEQDYSRTVSRAQEDNTRTVSRAYEDASRTISRAQEDYTRTVTRAQEDFNRSVTRSEEDFNRTVSRAYQDYSKTTLRAIEDYGITAGRATEDANRDRLRSDQDYARSRLELERNTARSLSDINRGLKEGLISIIAPGLASSQGYQIAKLLSDTARQKQRLGEDTQFSQQGLDLNYSRQQEDILRSETRTLADAMRSLSRGLEDANITLSRSLEDATITLTRSLEDAALTYSRTLEDASVTLSRTLEDASISLSRTLEDAGISLSRSLEDAGITFQRGMQDLGLENARASFDNLTQASDSLVDANLALRDANITEARSLEDLGIQHTRTMQDIDTQYQRTIEDAQTSFTRAMQDLTLDEKDAAKEHTRNLADLALAEQRGKEDFDFAMQGIQITADRWQRDMLLNLAEFDQQMATELGTSLAAIQNLTDSYRIQMGQQPQNPDSNHGEGGASWGTGHAKGFNNVPYAEYPARLHPGEMVVTREESNVLRSAGYLPESKNLGQALRNLFLQNAPGYDGGYNGITMPDGYGGDSAHPNKKYGPGGWQSVSYPAVWGYLPGQTSGPMSPSTPFGVEWVGGNQSQSQGTNPFRSADPNSIWYDPSLNNPTFANSNTPGYGTPMYQDPNVAIGTQGWLRNQEIARSAQEKYDQGLWDNLQNGPGGYMNAVNKILPAGYSEAVAHGGVYTNPYSIGGKDWTVTDYVSMIQRMGGVDNGGDPMGYLNRVSGSMGQGSFTGNPKATLLPAPSASRQIPQMQVSQGFASNGQAQIILKPTFNLTSQDQVAIITKALKKFKTDVEGQLAELSNTQATRTGYYA